MESTDWAANIDDIGPRLYRYFCGSFAADIADDLTQETLVRVVQKRHLFDPQQGNLSMFAFGIARNVRFEQLKRRTHRELDALTSASGMSPSPDEKYIENERVTWLRHAIQRLKPIEQEILLLMIDDELTLETIGAVLKIPTGTVKSHISRAKAHLKELLKEKGVDYD